MVKLMVHCQLQEPFSMPAWPMRMPSVCFEQAIENVSNKLERAAIAKNILSRTLDGMLAWNKDDRLTMISVNMCLSAYDEE